MGALFASDWLCIHTHLRLMAIVAVAHGPSIGPAGARLCSEALAATDDRLHTTFGPQAPLLHRLVVLEPTEVQVWNNEQPRVPGPVQALPLHAGSLGSLSKAHGVSLGVPLLCAHCVSLIVGTLRHADGEQGRARAGAGSNGVGRGRGQGM